MVLEKIKQEPYAFFTGAVVSAIARLSNSTSQVFQINCVQEVCSNLCFSLFYRNKIWLVIETVKVAIFESCETNITFYDSTC